MHVYYTYMTKKLTITVSDEVYEGLYRRIGRRKISGFLNNLVRDRLRSHSLAAEYAEAAKDEQAEREALEWVESAVDECLPDENFSGWPRRSSR